MAHEAQKWMRRLLLFVCVLDGLSLAPSHPSHARPHASCRRGIASACFAPSRRGIASACFAPCGLLPCSPMSGQGIKLCVHPVLRRAECLVGGRRRCWATFQRGADSGTRRASHLRMVMPGSSGFEEAEDVAERLFRLKTAVQSREDEFDGSKKSADEAAGDEIGEKIVVDIDLERPLGFTLKEVAGYGIYVDYVDMGGSAQMRGVQRGDRVLATSATLGGSMWEKSTMAGVLSALHSGTLFSNTVRIRFERDPVLASIVGFSAESSTSRVDLARALISVERARLRIQQSTIENFEVALPLPGKNKAFLKGENPFNGQLPYGMLLAQDEQGVFVADISPEGTAADSGLLRIGDRIVATQGSIGTQLWPKKTLDGILSAVTTRMGNSITLKIERKVQLGSWEQRSVRVIPASPLDKVAYYSTSGAGISIRKNATIAAETSVLEVEAGGGKGVRKARRSTLSSSLVLLPDEKGWDMVQEVRLSHDRKVRMWPPHITLLRPFVRVEDFPAAAELLDEILNDFPPMKLQFEMRVIKHHDYCTSLWLVPADESRDKIAELQQSVQAVFPQCKRSKYLLRLLNKNRYLPHMTLGQFTTEAEASVLKALYEEKFSTVTFSVNHLFLLSRPDRTGPVEQMRVRLGPSTSESQGLSSAVSEYVSLKKAGVELNASTTRNVLLERCSSDVFAFGKKNNVSAITEIVQDLKQNKVEMDSKLLNAVMGAYIKCSRPELAVQVFHNFTAARGEQAGEAGVDSAGEKDRGLNVDASVHCYSTLIAALGRTGELERAHAAMDRMVQSGPAPNIRVINALLGACVRQNNLTAAEKLFSSLTGVRGEGFATFVTPVTDAGVCVAVQPDEYSFNIMINAYARAKQINEAFNMLLEMRRANCSPDRVTYSTLIKACVAKGQMPRAIALLDEMAQMRMSDVFAYNTIMAGLAKRKQWKQTSEFLERMEEENLEPDLMSYSHAITACVRASRMSEAKRHFGTMQDKGIVPNRHVYSTMMAGFGEQGALNEAQQLFKSMQERRVRPNEFTMSSLIEAYLKAGYAADAIRLQDRLPEMGLKMDDVLETQRIRALAQQGLFANATQALADLVRATKSARGNGAKVGPIPYNEIIKQAQMQRDLVLARHVLELMLKDKVAPNRMTYELIVAVKDKSWQGMKRVQYFLDIISLVRQYRLMPMGPLYVEALQSSVDANEPELAGLLLEECADGKFSISRAEHDRIEQLETRVLNLMRMSADGKWYARVGNSRLGSGRGARTGSNRDSASRGSPFLTGSANTEWDFRGDYSADPQDRDFYSAEWW